MLARDHRLGRGDRLAYLGLNHPVAVALLFACARIGAMLVPLNWRLAVPELAQIIADCRPRVLIHQQPFAQSALAACTASAECRTLDIETLACDRLPGGKAQESGRLGDPLLIVYTSGTTGRAKGAVLSQRALWVNALNSLDLHALKSSDKVLVVLPLFHVGGLNILLTPALYVGASVVLHARFDARATLAAIEVARPELLVLVPVTMQALVAAPSWRDADLSSLRMLTTGSTVVPLELIATFEARGVPIVQVYGATETCPIAAYQRPGEGVTHPRSTGRAALCSELRLIDDTGAVIEGAGSDGEIEVRGAHLFEGYWNQAEASERAFDGEWFRTADIGAFDGDGYLYFKDRKQHLIISGGENIYPAELERIVSRLPGVAEAAVVGVPDERWGEVPVVALVAERQATHLSTRSVLAAYEGELARYKHPKQVVFVKVLPRNAMGKVVPAKVRDLVLRQRAAGCQL